VDTIMPRVLNKHIDPIPVGAIYIGRGSPYGNPYRIGEHGTRKQVIELFEKFVLPDLDVSTLRGCDLVCYCSPKPCHGDSILKKANSSNIEEWL
jgi:hypothetical protein